MKKPTVAKFMSASPHTIGAGQTLAAAHRMMGENRIRHLPVLDGGRLVGVVSQRDLYLLETIRDVDPENTLVEEAMTGDPYVVPPATPLVEVARTLLQHRWGSAIVADGTKVSGVFTTTDALAALLDLLEPRPATPRRPGRARKGGARRIT